MSKDEAHACEGAILTDYVEEIPSDLQNLSKPDEVVEAELRK
jgi:hypothetical protein